LKKIENMGRVVQLTNKSTGKTTPAYISIDRLTNNIVTIPVNKSVFQKRLVIQYLPNKTSKNSMPGISYQNKEFALTNEKKFTATLQVNVEQRGVEFVPHNSQLKQENPQSKLSVKELKLYHPNSIRAADGQQAIYS